MNDKNTPLTNHQLQLGDIVMMSDQPFGHQFCVQQIKDDWLTFFQPYIHRENFSFTGGVLCFTGIASPMKIQIDDTRITWVLIDRIKIR